MTANLHTQYPTLEALTGALRAASPVPDHPPFAVDLSEIREWPGTARWAVWYASGFTWPAGTTVQRHRGGRWTAWLDRQCGCRFSHWNLAVVHEMITAAANPAVRPPTRPRLKGATS